VIKSNPHALIPVFKIKAFPWLSLYFILYMNLSLKRLFFKDAAIKTFSITRLAPNEIEEKVWLKKGERTIDITHRQSMICLDPFCISVWLPADALKLIDANTVQILFTRRDEVTASLKVSLIEIIATPTGSLLLYKIVKVKNNQLTPLHRLLFLGHLLRSPKNTYQSRRTISALYSYPRKVIIVSYQDDEYYNIFPMDIQSHIAEEDIYVLGLRTTNITLDKILAAKKVVICDTHAIALNTVYDLGKHSSTSPTKKEELPFGIIDSELFGFPVPAILGSYKEVEIIHNRKMGYHMLLVGKVVNSKVMVENPSSFYHVGFLQSQISYYPNIEGIY
jgi:flavin reductase (DIM6/NTAB) family NADH-FMN oxidoreductase RutF